MNKMKWVRVGSLLLVLVLLGVLYWSVRGFSWEELWHFASQSVTVSVAVILGLYCIKTILVFIPLFALYAGAGFLFSPSVAILITYIGLTLEFTLGFFLGRLLGKAHIKEKMERKKYSKWLVEAAEQNAVLGSFLIRMLPGPPCDVTNMFFGTLNIGFVPFLFFSLLGTSPGMIPVVFAGKAASNPFSKEFLVPFSIALLFAAVSAGVSAMVKKRKNGEKQKDS